MTMNFVVAFDGSAASERALEHAIRVTSGLDSSLTVVHAVDPQVYSSGGDAPVRSRSDAERRLVLEAVEDAERRGEELLERAAATAEDAGFTVETELLYGAPVAAVADLAEARGTTAYSWATRDWTNRTSGSSEAWRRGWWSGRGCP